MNTQEKFSSHLIPWNPLIARPTCSSVKRPNTTGRLSNPHRILKQLLIAPAPTHDWNPNHTIAGRPLRTPGIFTPVVPKLDLSWTTYGIPYLCPALPISTSAIAITRQPIVIARIACAIVSVPMSADPIENVPMDTQPPRNDAV